MFLRPRDIASRTILAARGDRYTAAQSGPFAFVQRRHYATGVDPFLVSARSGKTIAKVVAFGFGGGTVVLGLVTTLSLAFSMQAAFAAVRGYFLAALPFFFFGAVLAACRRELWFVPEAKAFRMLTFRPWLFKGPRVEQASLDDYHAVCAEVQEHSSEQASTLVVLVTKEGHQVPVREVDDAAEADTFAQQLSDVTGLPLTRRAADEADQE